MGASVGSLGSFQQQTKTISITSGKGGVGKSTLVANLAYSFSSKGQKVLILDGDLGMANVDVMFGARSRYHLEHVLSGQKQLKDIIVEVSENVFLIPGGSGIEAMQMLTPWQRQFIMDQVNELDENFDVMLIDTASGIDANVLSLNSAAQEIMVVVTPEPSSLTDAYALIKVMHKNHGENRFSIVLNMVQDEAEALSTYQRLSDVAQNFLNVSLDYRGYIPMDIDLRMATKSQHLVTRDKPDSKATIHINEILRKVSDSHVMPGLKGGMQFFWEQLVGQAS